MLGGGWSLGSVAEALGPDAATLYRYAHAFAGLGPEQYRAHERPGYRGLLTSAQPARLCREVSTALYTACGPFKPGQNGRTRCRSRSPGRRTGSTGWALPTSSPPSVPCGAKAAAQAALLGQLYSSRSDLRLSCGQSTKLES